MSCRLFEKFDYFARLRVDDLDCLLSLLLSVIKSAFAVSLLPMTIRMAKIWTAFSHYCVIRSEDDQNDQDLNYLLSIRCHQVTERRRGKIVGMWCPECHWWVLFTCQIVTPSLSFCCFTEPSNLLAWTRGFCMLAHSVRGPGGWIPLENVCLWVQIVPWKFQPISFTFTPSKSHLSVLFGVAPSPGGFLLSTLAPKWAVLTLTCVLDIMSQYHIYTFHIKILLQHVSVQHKRCRHAWRNYLWPGLYYHMT